MRSRLVLLGAAALAAGCAATDGRDMATRDREQLERQLAGRMAGPPQACVTGRQGQALRAVDRRTIVYDGGREIWVNRLEADCPGMRPDSILIVEPSGDRYCRLDRIRPLDRAGAIPGPVCPLGNWTPYRRAGS
jgi:hypothetical protein